MGSRGADPWDRPSPVWGGWRRLGLRRGKVTARVRVRVPAARDVLPSGAGPVAPPLTATPDRSRENGARPSCVPQGVDTRPQLSEVDGLDRPHSGQEGVVGERRQGRHNHVERLGGAQGAGVGRRQQAGAPAAITVTTLGADDDTAEVSATPSGPTDTDDTSTSSVASRVSLLSAGLFESRA